MPFRRAEHQIIADLLQGMNGPFLDEGKCFFGGGTAIVLLFGEYRRSLDVDFLCSSTEGFRTVRDAVTGHRARALFPAQAQFAREPRLDQYGIRLFVIYRDLSIKFEIVKEARISLEGRFDPSLGVPVLSLQDMFAEKLLANADRCQDRSVGYRDALDLGRLVEAHGEIPSESLEKATRAYGADIERKLHWVLHRLKDESELRDAAAKLDMNAGDAVRAIQHLRIACGRIWPSVF
ncbi:MAG: nucleotidyl transferase AbiEii/AbiGii toxin family protein [Rhizobiaceae bacterium]|nr:nucleotidyl transferase AbiEii/AbiGii toxin family protein [Rhizobiaceae bacterium]